MQSITRALLALLAPCALFAQLTALDDPTVPFGNVPSAVNARVVTPANTAFALRATKFSGAGTPGSVATSARGDLYLNTTANDLYVCVRTTACSGVASTDWVKVNGTGVGSGTIEKALSFGGGNASGSPTAIGDKPVPPHTMAASRTLSAVYAVCDSAPVGSAFTVSILKNGSATGSTVSVSAGATSGNVTGLSISFVAGDTFGGVTTSVGSTTAAKGCGLTGLFN